MALGRQTSPLRLPTHAIPWWAEATTEEAVEEHWSGDLPNGQWGVPSVCRYWAAAIEDSSSSEVRKHRKRAPNA